VRWFDLTLWGGVLMQADYAIGTVYERNQKTPREIEDGDDGMLVILDNFLANQNITRRTPAAFRCAPPRLRKQSDWLRAASKTFARGAVVQPEGVWNDQRSSLPGGAGGAGRLAAGDAGPRQGRDESGRPGGGSLRRAIPIVPSQRQMRQSGGTPDDVSFEVQVLVLAEEAEEYEGLTSGERGAKMSPRRAGSRDDSLVLNGFTAGFVGPANGAGA
jgi:hypothetical protein